VIACNLPVRVPAVPLQSDARETALDSREPRYAVMDLLASSLDRNAPTVTKTDRLSLAAIVSGVMAEPAKDGLWPAGCVIEANRMPNALLDRGPTSTESTAPSARSAVI
jgi:hypothetical protein